MTHSLKKSVTSNTLSRSPQSCPIDRDSFIATQPSISTLRRGRDTEKVPVRRVSTWIRNQKKEARTFIDLRENPLISILF
jgi:hypothetical protein